MRKLWWILLLVVIYFFSRFLNLTLLPIFTDEAIYIRWAQIAEADAVWRFISLTDGKQPLFIWLMMFPIKFLKDPLFAGRLITVLAGFLSLIGIFFLAKHLYNEKVGFFSCFLYLLVPFFLFYDRLALMDSLLTTFMIWGIYLEILLAKNPRLDLALLLGMVIGGGILTKSSAFFLLYFLPLSLIFFKPKEKGDLFYWTGLASISIVISQLIYAVQRLSPFYHMINLKNNNFIYTFKERFSQDLPWLWESSFGNLNSLVSWLVSYLTWPVIILIFYNLYHWKKEGKPALFLLAWFCLPFISLAFFGKILYPRFILFMAFPLLILAANGLEKLSRKIKNGYWFLVVSFLLFLYPLYFDWQILTKPLNMPLPSVDRGQYLDDWPSGYGVPEVIEFLKKESEKGPLFLATEGTFGLTPYAFEIYLKDYKNIKIMGYWPISDGMAETTQKSKELPTFLVLKDTQKPREDWPVKLIEKFQKGKGNVYLGLYKVGQKE